MQELNIMNLKRKQSTNQQGMLMEKSHKLTSC
jgi:hypothetical protein